MGIEQLKVKLNPDVGPAGSDLSIVNAARRSFNTRSEWDVAAVKIGDDGPYMQQNVLKDKDKRLLEFLARGMTADDFEAFQASIGKEWYNGSEGLIDKLWQWRNTPTHDTPFNHTFISFEVQAPIFVRAQLVKHEYLILSEFSRRYITDGIEFYKPDYWRKAAPNKKQGSSEEAFNPRDAWGHYVDVMGLYLQDLQHIKQRYREFVGENGDRIAPEVARMMLPQSTMTEWTWSGTLGAFAKMCTLRLHPEAQYESRIIAQQVYDYLKIYYPVAAPALVEGVK